MKRRNPGVLRPLVQSSAYFFSAFIFSSSISAAFSYGNSEPTRAWSGINLGLFDIGSTNNPLSGAPTRAPDFELAGLIEKAKNALMRGFENEANVQQHQFAVQGALESAIELTPKRAVQNETSTSVRFVQTYKGLEVVGQEAMVHFDPSGNIHDMTSRAITTAVNVNPVVSPAQALKILRDRYENNSITLSSPAVLKILKDFQGNTHLTYHMLTKTTPTHAGQEVYLDAHRGNVVLDFDRAYDAISSSVDTKGRRTVLSADTSLARANVDARGYPTDLNLSWYDRVIDDGEYYEGIDRSASNAYRNSGKVYQYYKTNFNRKSFDDRDSRLLSVVHMGSKMNNAFWTTEFGVMAYGDGDGEHLLDLTYGLDVAAHEMTHGVTATTANLVYAAESGALNESYSDFFGKMVDYTDGDWDLAAKVMAPKWGRRALRNLKNPEEFKQPGTNDSPLRVSTTQACTRNNDRCGVHTNSGIPNRAAALIVEKIGKRKTEQLYYKVLTTRLTATSDFHEMRVETEKECALMFGGTESAECRAVRSAYDTVKIL